MTLNGILLVLGGCVQVCMSALLGMMGIFAGASIVDRRNPEPWVANLLGACVFVLPALGLLTAGVLIYMAFKRPVAMSHLWHLVSVVPFAAYFAWIAYLMR